MAIVLVWRRNPRVPTATTAALYRRDSPAEGSGGRGRLEHARPGAGRGRLLRGLRLAQPGRVPHRPGRDHRVPAPEMGPGTRLRAAQGPVVLPRKPDRRPVPVRIP